MESRIGLVAGRPRPWSIGALAVMACLLTACNLNLSMQAEAKDTVTRTFTLARGGTLEILNTNGRIQIDATDGSNVEVVAERIARGGTDQAAKDALAKVEIKETITPDHITLDSQMHMTGINLFGGSRTVNYRVKVPRWANVRLDTTNSDIEVTGVTGAFRATATNGHISATGLENGAIVETTNGKIDIAMSKLSDDGVTCTTTNGEIIVILPKDAKAHLSARVTNGAISDEGLTLAVSERSRRRLDATIGGGGPTVKLETTNGAVVIKGR